MAHLRRWQFPISSRLNDLKRWISVHSRSTMIIESCTSIGIATILLGSIGNWLCIGVFFRKRFRSSVLTPFFVSLLIADCIYLTLRVIKLFYYQETLFQRFSFGSSCSLSIFIRSYGYITQYAPQIFVPLCQYELYIRFSLILMCFLAVQRAVDMYRSSYRLIQRSSSSGLLTYVLILSAFLLAYLLEFLALSVFCSSALSSTVAYQWYEYLSEHLSNETVHLMQFMHAQSANATDIDCLVYRNSSCSPERNVQLARKYPRFHRSDWFRLGLFRSVFRYAPTADRPSDPSDTIGNTGKENSSKWASTEIPLPYLCIPVAAGCLLTDVQFSLFAYVWSHSIYDHSR